MIKKILLSIFSILPTSVVFGQSTAEGGSTSVETLVYVVIGLVLVISVLVLLVAIYTLFVVKTILLQEQAKGEEEGAAVAEEINIWKKIFQSLTMATPIEKEQDILLDHNYDGIRELDNHLPPWWKWLFYLSIVWGMVYLVVYHVFDLLPLQDAEYQNEIVMAEAAKAERAALVTENIDENNVEATTDQAKLDNGATIFQRQCAVCHAADGGGSVGPNMTDDYYIHGGDIKSIFNTIKYGVPSKGMISWESQLNPSEMRDVSSYIMTLRGTTPANPKEPQGELYTPENADGGTAAAADSLGAAEPSE